MMGEKVTFGVRWILYQRLTSEFPFEEPIDIANVGASLRQGGFRYEDYGYEKLVSFLRDVAPFVEVVPYENNGPQYRIVLHRVDDWTQIRALDEDAETGEPNGQGADGLKVVLPEGYDTRWAAELVERGLYLPHELPQNLLDFLMGDDGKTFSRLCHIPAPLLPELYDIAPDNVGPTELLEHDWYAVRNEQALRYEGGQVVWPLHMLDANQEVAVELRMEPHAVPAGSAPDFKWDKPWILRSVDVRSRRGDSVSDPSPMREIDSFARIPWPTFLADLSRIALRESWDFEGTTGSGSHGILKAYVELTFYRLKLEDKVAINKGGTFAAFNTGLATPRYDEIYACFEKSASARLWTHSGFCTAGSTGLGKKLVREFSPLPQRASYFNAKEDVLYDVDKELVIDYEHALVDNVDRLPLNFLLEETAGFPDATAQVRGLMSRVEAGETIARNDVALAALRKSIKGNDRLFKRLRCRLDDAVAMALRRQRLDWRTAVPGYHPRLNRLSFLLPLDFLDDDVVDNVLVVAIARPSGNYLGETLLTMPQAYSQARLIASPSGWLVPMTVSKALDRNEFLG